MLRVVADEARGEVRGVLDEIVAEGARRMLAAALEAEVDTYLAGPASERDERGHRLVVRNGHAELRTITSGAGAIEVRAPRVDDRRTDPETGQQVRFRSAILPPWCRNSPKVAEVLAPVSRCRRSGKCRNVSVIFRPTGPKYRESPVGHRRIA